ncbi:MAG: glycosyl transferase 4 family protein [Betaproteobacteria bacterium]|nr:glycosyl transferase 4 family protein [Betaproteobacteria bacterium]
MIELIAPACAFAMALFITWLMLRTRWQWALDKPNERSLHTGVVPRTGGLAIIAGLCAAAVMIAAAGGRLPLWQIGAPVLLLVLLSLIDDRRSLPVRVRLPAHLLAALWFVLILALAGGGVAWVWVPLLVIGVAGFANLYNFMDGANGLAGGMAVFGFTSYGLALSGAGISEGAGDPALAALCFAIAAAAAGFLCFNLSGRIFMGDAGSVPLGFMAAAIGVQGWAAGHWPCWFPLLVFAPFALDGTVTVMRRMLRRERFWEAHRQHYYQRLVRLGWSHSQLAAAAYALMALCGAGALWALEAPPIWFALIFATIALLFVVLALLVDAAWRRAQAKP